MFYLHQSLESRLPGLDFFMLLVRMRSGRYFWKEFDHVIKLCWYVLVSLESVQVLTDAHHESMGHSTSEYPFAGWGYARGGLDPTIAHVVAGVRYHGPTRTI